MLETDILVERIAEEIYKKLLRDGTAVSPGSAGGARKSGGLASMIDHTLLKQDAGEDAIRVLCREARENRFASVCVNPCYVPLCSRELRGSDVKVCTVIGFPLGATTIKAKVFEAGEAVENGAGEVDMVVNVGKIKSGDWEYVRDDIESVVMGVNGRAVVKVIIETCLLSEEEKVRVCQICKEVGADFVKTSTGFSTGGATPEDIALMRRTVGPDMGVKASGGIKDAKTAQAMVDAGATRLGTSSGVEISQGRAGTGSY